MAKGRRLATVAVEPRQQTATRHPWTSPTLAQSVLDTAPLLAWTFDRESGRIDYCNSRALAALGYSSLEAYQKDAGERRLDPSDERRLRVAIDELEESGGRETVELTYPVQTRTGGTRWVASRISCFERDAGGRLLRLLGISTDVTELRATRQRLADLEHELMRGVQRERSELAALLHDSVCQLLPLASMKLGRLRGSLSEEARVALDDVARIVREAHETAASLTFRLSPPGLREVGLVAALESLADDFRRDYGLEVKIRCESGPNVLSGAVEYAAYRNVHELLNNVARHARTQAARVSMLREGRTLRITVDDGGVGFDSEASMRGGNLGLKLAFERLAFVGGAMEVYSRPGEGTRAELHLPLVDERGASERVP